MCRELRDERLHIREERVWSASRVVPLFAIVEPSVGLASDVEVAYDNFARGGKKPRVTCTDQISLLTQMSSSARFQSSHKKAQTTVPQYCRRYQSLLQNLRLLDPRPREMRGYSYRNDNTLDEHGTNLSAVLFDLCRTPTMKETVLDFIRDVPEQDIEDIDFILTRTAFRLSIPTGQFQPNECATECAVAEFQGALVDLGEFQRDRKADAVPCAFGVRSCTPPEHAPAVGRRNTVPVVLDQDRDPGARRTHRYSHTLVRVLECVLDDVAEHFQQVALVHAHREGSIDKLEVDRFFGVGALKGVADPGGDRGHGHRLRGHHRAHRRGP